MTDADLLVECKVGLNIPVSSTAFDATIKQKLLVIKSFMLGAGVREELFSDPAAVGAIVMGVTDIWDMTGGSIKFSPAFYTLVGQLALKGPPAA